MKFDPNSKVRSQRELMQPFQIRLMKEQIRDLQLLRVFAGVKVSEDLRQLVTQYIDERKPLLRDIVGAEAKILDAEQVEAANSLGKMGGLIEKVGERKPGKK